VLIRRPRVRRQARPSGGNVRAPRGFLWGAILLFDPVAGGEALGSSGDPEGRLRC
jgi:hypothetical protein